MVAWRASWASVKCLGQRGAKAAKQKYRSEAGITEVEHLTSVLFHTESVPEDHFMLSFFLTNAMFFQSDTPLYLITPTVLSRVVCIYY